MSSNAALAPQQTTQKKAGALTSSKKIIQETQTPEMVIALCGMIGSPLRRVSESLNNLLTTAFSYEVRVIKLSQLIKEASPLKPDETHEFDRIKALINQGNHLRKEHGASILAELAIKEIHLHRLREKETNADERFVPRRVCHIIDSLKSPEELELLRTVYGDLFFCIGVFSPEKFRETNLVEKNITKPQAYDLMAQDWGEKDDHGQAVQKTFYLADFFLKITSEVGDEANRKLKRFLDAVLRTQIVTPTADERAMNAAAAAALNSACLSRQVGAAITDRNGEVLGVGWNDVPKFGGDLYKDEDHLANQDFRCAFKGSKCHNDHQKKLIANQISNILSKAGFFDSERNADATELLFTSDLKDLIEFSRAVHAEMHALITASKQHGHRVERGRVYITTFPCHSCARHLVAAGITEIFYIEPYAKSLALKLHGDAITQDEADLARVRVLAFEGIAPRRYRKTFEMPPNSRKKDGNGVVQDPSKIRYLSGVTLESIPVIENTVVTLLNQKKPSDEHGIRTSPDSSPPPTAA